MDLPAALDAFRRWLTEGGHVMAPLVGCAVVLWWALGYRLAILRRGRRGPVAALLTRARAGTLGRPRGIVDAAAVEAVTVAAAVPEPDRRPRALELALAAHREPLTRYAVLARAIVAVAPLAGLLGTVSGMIEMFDGLSEQVLHSQDGGIAGGIAEALLTTELGLAIAIPGLLASRMLDRRADRLGDELTQLKALAGAGQEAA